jgi:hypothetical protein
MQSQSLAPDPNATMPVRGRRRVEARRQRPARAGLSPQPADPTRDRPVVRVRQDHANMRACSKFIVVTAIVWVQRLP